MSSIASSSSTIESEETVELGSVVGEIADEMSAPELLIEPLSGGSSSESESILDEIFGEDLDNLGNVLSGGLGLN